MSTCPTPRDHSQKVWCFQCGNEYFPEVTQCIECGVATTPTKPPDVTVLGNPGEDHHLAYDFHEWAAESRSMIEALLNGAQIIHIWQGASLMVREADEPIVDEFISEVDAASRPVLDPSSEKTIYDLDEMTDSQVTSLTQELEQENTPYEINEDGDLTIETKDELTAEAIFDRMEERARKEAYMEQNGERMESGTADNIEVPSLLSDLHRLSTRLEMLTPLTSADIVDARRVLNLIPQLALPFGFSFQEWDEILDRASLVDELMVSGTSEEISSGLQEAGIRLKEALPISG